MRRKLPAYEAKRDFSVTSEPAPVTLASHDKPIFVVHKHDATRLHYDVRLEIDGALASWSVPKGPSDNPSVKRLAIQTEDHPLEYASFEGRIPDGEYGAGDSLIWDQGTCEPAPDSAFEARLGGRRREACKLRDLPCGEEEAAVGPQPHCLRHRRATRIRIERQGRRLRRVSSCELRILALDRATLLLDRRLTGAHPPAEDAQD